MTGPSHQRCGEGREHRIINGLLILCIIAGFACFSLFVLPDQLRKARAFSGTPQDAHPPTKLSAIIPLEETPTAAPARLKGNIARFIPEGMPATPEGSAENDAEAPAPNTSAPRPPLPDDDLAAGGAGAAIDNESAEAWQTLAFQNRQTDSPDAALPTASPQDVPPLSPDASATVASQTPPTPNAYPVSSLARKEPSALDTLKKKAWYSTPSGFEADVAFWLDIYTKYDSTKVVMHHPRHLRIIYDVVDLADIMGDVRLSDIEKQHLRESRVENRRREITEVLLKLAEGPPASALSDEAIRIRKLFANIPEADAFRRAAQDDGVRSQTGQRDKFIPGLKYSGRYLGEIEAIFATYGMPRELTRLIFVESMFNPRAVSSVGASGIWQFMPATGKLYVQINDLVDERNDPITATHAAAKLLRQNYEALGTWPLALGAYNAGRGRLAQAVARVGSTDIGRIIREFDHPAYGFASRNFFLEFLAALEAAEHAEKYFGPIDYDRPLRTEMVRLASTVALPDVARIANIPLEEILELNPALTQRAAAGLRPVPMGFSLRVPEGKGEIVLAAAARAPRSRIGPVRHVVRQGETLQSIAKMYRVTPQQIVKSNRDMSWRVRPGQTISVPVEKGAGL